MLVDVKLQVQVGSKCYLFDVLEANKDAMQRMKLLLEDTAVVKVVHDCRLDSVALFHQKGIVMSNIFDTQVSRNFAVPPIRCCTFVSLDMWKVICKFK